MNPRIYVAVVGLFVLAAPSVPVGQSSAEPQEVVSTIFFTSTRNNTTAVPPITGGEIYALDYLEDGTFAPARRLTSNTFADIFPTLAPDGNGRIVFDSNRRRAGTDPVNVSDLFLTNHDWAEPVFLARGGSPTWSPARGESKGSRMIAFHASASGTGLPVNPFPVRRRPTATFSSSTSNTCSDTARRRATSRRTAPTRWTTIRAGPPTASGSRSRVTRAIPARR